MNNNLEIVAAIPIFNGLPEDQIAAIKQIAVTKRFNKGQVIFSEGDAGKGFFVISQGRVKIFKYQPRAKNIFCIYTVPGNPLERFLSLPAKNFRPTLRRSPKDVCCFFF